MANIFEAYAGALGLNGQEEELQGWLEKLWDCGVFGDLGARVSDWITTHRERLEKFGEDSRERKRRKKQRT